MLPALLLLMSERLFIKLLKKLVSIFLLSALVGCSGLPFLGDKNGKDAAAGASKPMVQVLVEGVDEIVAKNIRVHMNISRYLCSTPVDLIKRRNDKTLAEIRNALHAYGYYLAEIDITVEQGEQCPLATITVEPGERMQVAKVEVTIGGAAANDSEFQDEIQDLPIKQGQFLNHDDYRRSKALLESVAAELGYLDGQYVVSTLTIDIENYVARAALHYDSGERYQLGTISIDQQPEFLDEGLIKRILETPKNRDYATAKMMAMQNRLLISDYFKSVNIKPGFDEAKDKSIPLQVSLSPNEKHHFFASLGFATDEGLRSRLGYNNRRFNEFGHQLGLETRLSQSELGLSSYYRIPRENPSNEWLRFAGDVRQRDYDSYETVATKFAISETKRRPWAILEDHFIAVSFDDYEVGNETGRGLFLIPGVSWEKRSVDNDLFTTHGFSVTLNLRGATEAIISDTSFFRSSLKLNYVRSLPFDMRAIARGHLGWMWVDEFRELPPSERFFAGGDNNLRGYDFETLGPVNDDGFVIGGSELAIVSIELEKYLTQQWGVAAFVDSGNAYAGPGRDTGIKTGVGIGLRWRSPFGPVRIDLAHPLDLDDTWFKLHLRIGPDL